MGKSPSDSRRRTKSKRAMKLAIYVLFLAAASTGCMPIGNAENTLAENQKLTSMKIQNELSIERQHNDNETLQLYEYIDASISHATAQLVKRITGLTTSPPSRLPMITADTTPTPSSTKSPCIANGLKNC